MTGHGRSGRWPAAAAARAIPSRATGRWRTNASATAGGVPMLVRVVQALRGSARIGRIIVSVDDVAVIDQLPELTALRDAGRWRRSSVPRA